MRYFSARGVCAKCGGEVGLGRTHVEWLTARLGMWLCDPAGEVFEVPPPAPSNLT